SPAVGVLLSARPARARVRAAESIGRTRMPGGRQALEAALNDPDARVRTASATALAAYGDAAAVPTLVAHGNDHNRRVRDAITAAVSELRAHASIVGAPSVGVVRPMVAGGGPPSGTVVSTDTLAFGASRAPVDWRRV